jgi:hypothetical protein
MECLRDLVEGKSREEPQPLCPVHVDGGFLARGVHTQPRRE